MAKIAKAAGWWWPFEQICILTERPRFLSRDADNRLHCEDRAAIEYRDGWGVYAWHGLRVPDWIILKPEEITPEKISAETNAEIRRVMIERYGVARYMVDSGAILVDQCAADHPLKGLQGAKLWRKDVPDDESIVMIECVNSTPEPDGHSKIYHLRVDPNAYGGKASTDCQAAMASTWRTPDGAMVFERPSDYAPMMES